MDTDGVAPKCYCMVYAVLHMSKTANNTTRLFFGCPFFKKSRCPHYKSFLWLDRHTEQLERIDAVTCAEEIEDVEKQLVLVVVESRVIELEERVAAMERKKKTNMWLIVGVLAWSRHPVYGHLSFPNNGHVGFLYGRDEIKCVRMIVEKPYGLFPKSQLFQA
ncbi:hypothetical protein PIB30_004342 [Stylosanthes scabra]|uniref:Zinc finger GRF-type domain-containing protein n=1 Tax=Stylosanthes scabra TaxID=79078 RepID=A0ABU6U680_9FABA|nr:hypothetical protein [Stylosanthes scabra]